MADLTSNIEESAQQPKKVTGDEGSVEQHPLADQIEADRYLKANAAYRKGLGIRHVKIIPPGTADRTNCR